jgi:hypothetical protein
MCNPAGYNVCIFAYGQTGSGKTHTMSGTDTMHLEGRGINYRALDDLFSIRDKRAEEVRPLACAEAAEEGTEVWACQSSSLMVLWCTYFVLCKSVSCMMQHLTTTCLKHTSCMCSQVVGDGRWPLVLMLMLALLLYGDI